MKVFDSKRTQDLHCRASWPVYASYDEDIRLRKEKRNEEYDGKRVVFWDDTNVFFDTNPAVQTNRDSPTLLIMERTVLKAVCSCSCVVGWE